jgi:hypothetical protein
MKDFIKNNFVTIVLFISLLTFFKGCSDSRKLNEVKLEITDIKNNTYTKGELNVILRIMSLETEKRFIQSTDRKILDVQRQGQIDEELKKLRDEKLDNK